MNKNYNPIQKQSQYDTPKGMQEIYDLIDAMPAAQQAEAWQVMCKTINYCAAIVDEWHGGRSWGMLSCDVSKRYSDTLHEDTIDIEMCPLSGDPI